MKFVVDRESLLEGLKLVGGAVSTRATLPVLNHVLLKAETDGPGLTLVANNLELMLMVKVAADVNTPGEAAVPHKLLQDIVTALVPVEDDRVSVEFADRTQDTAVRHGTAVVELKSINGGEMPVMTMAMTDAVSEHQLAASWLLPAMRSVMFAVAEDDTRPTLLGVNWLVGKNHSVMVATDGFRLALRQEAYPADGEYSLLLVARRLEPLLNALQATGEEFLTMTVNCNMVRFEAGPVTGYMQQIDARYPDYKPIVPTQALMSLEADREAMLQAARLAQVIAQNDRQSQAVQLMFEDAAVSILAGQDGIGSNRAKCEPVTVAGEPIEDVGINCKFLIDALAHAEGERVLMEFSEPSNPIVIRDSADGVWRCVIMPVHLVRR